MSNGHVTPFATITVPVEGDVISANAWGAPISNAVNSNTSAIAAIQPTVWTNLPLINGWVNWGSGVQNAQYRRIGDIVYIRGGIKGPGTASNVWSSLPAGFRPPAQVDHVALFYSGSRQVAAVTVGTDGSAYCNDVVPSSALLTINGIFYSTSG
jgi:hypothetical protein